MIPTIAVLGGSTPFTAALVEALRVAGSDLPACELRLFGRDTTALTRMSRYARARLGGQGWTASGHQRLESALAGASVVVNQIRFGDLAGRARDEELARRFDVPADETLGPCGLASALRVAPSLRELAQVLGSECPRAWVLNLANPLSVTTAVLVRSGAPARTVGLCELPRSTAREACRLLGMEPDNVAWEYVGLNHRGFITSLRHRGEELLPCLPELLGDRTVFGIGAVATRETGALPLKYFRLASASGFGGGRAEYLMSLKDDLARELEDPSRPPPSLARRKLDWYEGAVVPMMQAIFSARQRAVVIDSVAEDGLVHEHAAAVSREGFEPRPAPSPPRLARWLDVWTEHERAVMEAVEEPSSARIRRTLELDPVVPKQRLEEMAHAVRGEARG